MGALPLALGGYYRRGQVLRRLLGGLRIPLARKLDDELERVEARAARGVLCVEEQDIVAARLDGIATQLDELRLHVRDHYVLGAFAEGEQVEARDVLKPCLARPGLSDADDMSVGLKEVQTSREAVDVAVALRLALAVPCHGALDDLAALLNAGVSQDAAVFGAALGTFGREEEQGDGEE